MPEHFLRREPAPIDPMDDMAAKKLARRYGVSVQAMSFRLANLGIVKPDLG